MRAVAIVLALASVWGAGASVLALGRVRSGDLAHRLVVDIAAGAVLMAFVGTVTIVLGLRLSPTVLYLLLAVLVACALRWGRRGGESWTPVRDRLAVAVLASTGIVLTAVGAAASYDRLWWDGWAIWAFKARVLFLEGTLPPAFMDPHGPYVFTHLDYPLLVSLMDWWAFRHLGAPLPAAASFVGFLWFLLIPLLLWGGLRGRVGERMAASAALAAAACWPIAFYATGGTADVLVALALLGAIMELERALEEADEAALWRAGVFLALGAASKNEGLALALVGGCVAFLAPGRLARGRRVPALLLPLVVAAPWYSFTRGLGLESDVLTGWPGMAEAGPDARMLAGALLSQLGDTPWQPLSALGVLGLAAALRRPRAGIGVGWTLLAAYALVLGGVYVSAPQDLDWLIATTLPRVFGVMAPATLFLALASIRERPRDAAV